MESAKNLVENPNTALASETESEPQTPQKTPTKKKKKRRSHFVANFDIPGVHKVILPEITQKSIGCVAGDTVTAEKPWINVDKDLITEHLDLHVESSEFLPYKDWIVSYPENELLMGYIPDESNDFDEFYICVTEEATHAVNHIIKKLKKIQENKLNNAINKKVKKWRSLGSEKEVEEVMVRYSRSLIEVEIESKYPILPFKVQFRLVRTQDLRDGYMELRPGEEVSTIFKKRIDAAVQVTPSVLTNEAQTVCTYPKNSFTQYEYEVPEIQLQNEETVRDFVAQNLDSFCDILKVNGCIDLYSNDYENLVLDIVYGTKVTIPHFKEYFCFIDMNLCGGKMISSLTWHPMWTGCAIASYVDVAPSLYLTAQQTTDEIAKAIHDTNPVLFWSFCDDLKPKLILETPRPIYALSCCPHDENLIIGGCSNGQIILWDITQRLNNVEKEEILTVNQQKYRDYMFSLMNWMKNIFDLGLVRPTAVSDLKYSHQGCVNYISWMSPFYNVSKTGKIEASQYKPHSLTLLTSSEDGSVMIWDLLKKPIVTPGGFKAVRKLKRLKKKPSALSVMESPFKILHLNLKPIYKINLMSPSDNRILSISSCYMNFFKTVYEPTVRTNMKTVKLSDRLSYQPVLNPSDSDTRQTFHVGTMEGDYIQGTWDGQEFDSGEIVNYEDCTFVNYGKFHDGPVVKIDYAEDIDTILTVGGKIFALWRDSFKNRPILWRKGTSIYTHGSFFQFDNASIKLTRIDGNDEVWTLFYQSKSPLTIRLMSNGAITMATTHPRKLKNNVIALCDYRGSLRMFYRQHLSQSIVQRKVDSMSDFISREIIRKSSFLHWQTTWNERYKVTENTETKEEQIIFEEKETKRQEKKKIAKISPGVRYLEMVQEQQRINDQARIKSIILIKKQLDTEDLLKKREPLRKLEEENEVKKRKQKNKLRESDKIFKDQVAMLFPDVVKVKPAPPPNPYEDCYSDEWKKLSFDEYHDKAISAQDYVEEHPFSYEFSWVNVLKAGRERRKKLDEASNKHTHRDRFQKAREEKMRELPAVEEVSEPPKPMDEMSIASSL